MKQDIHWFPGHMAKTIRQLKEQINGIDIIIECLDARIPLSSRNPVIDTLIAEKQTHIIALTKTDLADPKQTEEWIKYFKNKADYCLGLIIPKHKGIKQLLSICDLITEKKKEKKRFHISKVLVCGIPNVGKSALINRCAAKAVAVVQNKPGVTKRTRGILLSKHLEIIDSPGLLWPKLDQEGVAVKLALCSAIKKSLVNDKDLCDWVIDYMLSAYPEKIRTRYKIPKDLIDVTEVIDHVAKELNFLERGGDLDLIRTYRKIIDDFHSNRISNISLEKASDVTETD